MQVGVNANGNSAAGRNGVRVGNFRAGDVIRISCSESEQWNLNIGSGRWSCNANGRPNTPLPMEGNHQIFQAGALVGSLDGGQTFFSVGTLAVITVCSYLSTDQEAELTLYCWDINDADNSGTIGVEIEVS